MNKPMTTEELFNEVHSILKENGKLPSILDYALATHSPVPIKTYEFDLVNKLALGDRKKFQIRKLKTNLKWDTTMPIKF